MSLEDRIHWALTHGIGMGLNSENEDLLRKIPMIHAPFTLQPYSFPRAQFDQAVRLAKLFNILVEKITRGKY
jgi:hypothetical protein